MNKKNTTVAETQQLEERRRKYSLTSDVLGFKNMFVNYYAIGRPGRGNPWWLVDAGLPGSGAAIIRQMEDLYGEDNPPKGIILTHGHFDHVGGLPQVIKKWPKVRVYAHPYEIPYLTGEESYPLPDPGAASGAMARMSWLFPVKPIDLKGRVESINEGRNIPDLPDWNVIHTPGHSPGHISLFRERDRTLIAGDAFITTNQNTLFHAVSQKPELHAPPAYSTINWKDAKKSIQKLEELEADAAGTGHGPPYFGEELRREMNNLLVNFEMNEIPANGHYVKYPVTYTNGEVRSVETPAAYRRAAAIGTTVAVAAVGAGIAWIVRRFTGSKATAKKARKKMQKAREKIRQKAEQAEQKVEQTVEQAADRVRQPERSEQRERSERTVLPREQDVKERPVVVEEAVIEERPVMVKEPVIEQQPVMVEEPVYEHRPVVVEGAKIERKPVLEEEVRRGKTVAQEQT